MAFSLFNDILHAGCWRVACLDVDLWGVFEGWGLFNLILNKTEAHLCALRRINEVKGLKWFKVVYSAPLLSIFG